MQTINNIYKYVALLAFTAIFCAGCQNDSDEWMPASEKNVMIELSVSPGELTRATPTGTEVTINSLRIYAFYGDKQVGYVYGGATAPGTPFYMDLELPETGTHNVDFYLIANEAVMSYENSTVTLSEKMTKEELSAVRFTGLRTADALPMYAVKIVPINVDAVSNGSNTISGHEGHFVLTQKVEFALERSLAKLSVYAAKTAGAGTDPLISKVELQAQGTRYYSYLFPQTQETLAGIASRSNNRVLLNSAVSITKEVTKGTPAAYEPTSYNEVAVGMYLPEVPFGSTAWDVKSTEERAAVLRVEYALGEGMETKNAYINLPVIQRNHHIKVCILINAEGQIIVNYEVADWDDFYMPDYHFGYPTHSYLREKLPTTDEEATAKPSGPAQMAENSPFVCYFQMTQPDQDFWTPTTRGLNASNCDIWVYDAVTKELIKEENFPIRASDKWYKIEVEPRAGMPITGEVELAISYRATGMTQSEFLLINGTTQEYYWPYEGSSVQDANYVIITMVN